MSEDARLGLVLDAVVSMGADLSLDEVLARIVDIARELAGARYAALGVLDFGAARGLRMFVHGGMTPAQVRRIGDLPTGHGLLGLLIDRPQPLRLREIAEHPVSFGFPPGHPPMSSFLGVPIRIGGRVFGNLYLTEKVGKGDFTQADEDLVVALAAAAGVAVENARLHEEAARRQDWLAATAEITGLLAGVTPVREALEVVAERARQVASADVAWIVVGSALGSAVGTGDGSGSGSGSGPGSGLVVEAVAGPTGPTRELASVPLAGTFSDQVVATGEPVTVPDLRSRGSAPAALADLGWPVLGPAIIVPLRTRDVVVGALGLAWTPGRVARFHEVDAHLPASFAEQAALALEVLRAREVEQRLALLEDRDRIGRDLHDLVIQRIFAVGLGLEMVSRTTGEPETGRRLEAAVEDLDATIRDIRRSIFALGSTQGAADLQSEVTSLVDRAATTLKFRPTLTLDGPLRTRVGDEVAPHLLAVLGEALSNASRHADAHAIAVSVTVGDALELVVSDDGRGLPPDVRESGLGHIRERAALLHGSCAVESSDAGTTITWTVPLP
ncbi:diguanylate cyclase [Marmoricola sp. Leaf446]|uniref:sensor histidine kinase n=1 Tax=Marmoricola sp. Leaf446 TaxID=1736379 RepID=UPI0006F26D49|nr:GAF domain-containing protein [Marmoricola sp. Leaf446]KQT94222.1 diguanylate cyclase [Marmoricola sp. Leaf446]